MIVKIKIEEEYADIPVLDVSCVCSKCLNIDRENASIQFDFKQQKVFYLCGKCKSSNEMSFGKQSLPPLPKTRIK